MPATVIQLDISKIELKKEEETNSNFNPVKTYIEPQVKNAKLNPDSTRFNLKLKFSKQGLDKDQFKAILNYFTAWLRTLNDNPLKNKIDGFDFSNSSFSFFENNDFNEFADALRTIPLFNLTFTSCDLDAAKALRILNSLPHIPKQPLVENENGGESSSSDPQFEKPEKLEKREFEDQWSMENLIFDSNVICNATNVDSKISSVLAQNFDPFLESILRLRCSKISIKNNNSSSNQLFITYSMVQKEKTRADGTKQKDGIIQEAKKNNPFVKTVDLTGNKCEPGALPEMEALAGTDKNIASKNQKTAESSETGRATDKGKQTSKNANATNHKKTPNPKENAMQITKPLKFKNDEPTESVDKKEEAVVSEKLSLSILTQGVINFFKGAQTYTAEVDPKNAPKLKAALEGYKQTRGNLDDEYQRYLFQTKSGNKIGLGKSRKNKFNAIDNLLSNSVLTKENVESLTDGTVSKILDECGVKFKSP